MKRLLILAGAMFLAIGSTAYGDGLLAPCAGVFCVNPTVGDGLEFDTGTNTLFMPVTGVSPGTYGDATHCASVTVNNLGLLTSASQSTSCPGSGGGGVTWPPSGSAVISNGTSSPDGVAEVDQNCLVGVSGTWTTQPCQQFAQIITTPHTVTAAEWGAGTYFTDTNGSAVTLPDSTTINTNAVLSIAANGSPVTVTANAGDTINGLSSVSIPSGATGLFSTNGAHAIYGSFPNTSSGSVNSGTAGQVGYYASTGTAISGESLSSLLDSSIGSTQGDILYRSASGWVALPPGPAGNCFQTGGTGANPSWGSCSTGGNGVYSRGGNCSALPTTTTAKFCPVSGQQNAQTGLPAVDQPVGGTGATITTLLCQVSVAPGTGNSHVFNLTVNDVVTGAACTIANSATSSTQTVSITVNPGDLIGWKDSPVGGPASASGFLGLGGSNT